jgi:hypothetical protein
VTVIPHLTVGVSTSLKKIYVSWFSETKFSKFMLNHAKEWALVLMCFLKIWITEELVFLLCSFHNNNHSVLLYYRYSFSNMFLDTLHIHITKWDTTGTYTPYESIFFWQVLIQKGCYNHSLVHAVIHNFLTGNISILFQKLTFLIDWLWCTVAGAKERAETIEQLREALVHIIHSK